MTNYLQIQGDPTTWWPAQPVQAAQLTQPTLNVTIEKPLVGGILVISIRAASIMLVSNDGGGPVLSD
jgi:hypothetical protein